MGRWLLHASFTEELVPKFLRERYNIALSWSPHLPQQPQHEPEQFLSRVFMELQPTSTTHWGFCMEIAAHKDGQAQVEECMQWKVCTGMPLDCLGNTWLGFLADHSGWYRHLAKIYNWISRMWIHRRRSQLGDTPPTPWAACTPISLVVHYHERPFTLVEFKEYSDDMGDDLLTTMVSLSGRMSLLQKCGSSMS